jgi:hypothetical protein
VRRGVACEGAVDNLNKKERSTPISSVRNSQGQQRRQTPAAKASVRCSRSRRGGLTQAEASHQSGLNHLEIGVEGGEHGAAVASRVAAKGARSQRSGAWLAHRTFPM